MKRIGKTSNLIGEICDYANISQSIDVVLRGRKRKQLRTGRYIMKNRDKIIARLQSEISGGTFKISGYREYEVTDGPKVRRVQSVNLYERIGCNAITHVVEKHVFGKYIRTTGDGENKSILDQMREQDLLGKVMCSVKSVRCKGFNRYVFV